MYVLGLIFFNFFGTCSEEKGKPPPFAFYEGVNATVLCRRWNNLTILNLKACFLKIISSKVSNIIFISRKMYHKKLQNKINFDKNFYNSTYNK
jgi:hypothetical protein